MTKKAKCTFCGRIIAINRADNLARHLNNSGSLCAGSVSPSYEIKTVWRVKKVTK